MEREKLLEQLYNIRHIHERRTDLVHTMSKYETLKKTLAGHRFFLDIGIRLDIQYTMRICRENMRRTKNIIRSMQEDSKEALSRLNPELVQDMTYVELAIDDLLMGRAYDVDGLNALFTVRSKCHRKGLGT